MGFGVCLIPKNSRSAKKFYDAMGMKRHGKELCWTEKQTKTRVVSPGHKVSEYRRPSTSTKIRVRGAVNSFRGDARGVGKRIFSDEGAKDRRIIVARDRYGSIRGVARVDVYPGRREVFVSVLATKDKRKGVGRSMMSYIAKRAAEEMK